MNNFTTGEVVNDFTTGEVVNHFTTGEVVTNFTTGEVVNNFTYRPKPKPAKMFYLYICVSCLGFRIQKFRILLCSVILFRENKRVRAVRDGPR